MRASRRLGDLKTVERTRDTRMAKIGRPKGEKVRVTWRSATKEPVRRSRLARARKITRACLLKS